MPHFISIKLDKSHFNKEAFNGGDNNSDGNLPIDLILIDFKFILVPWNANQYHMLFIDLY